MLGMDVHWSRYSKGIGGGDWRRESICRTARSAVNLKFKMESKDRSGEAHSLKRRNPMVVLRGASEDLGGPAPLGTGQQILLSHHPADGEQVAKLKVLLDGNGYSATVYDNQEQIFDGLEQLDHMMELVSEADGVIICMSGHYKGSKACRTEFEYSHYELGKPIILVNLEAGYIPEGWLDHLVGSQVWTNCESDAE